MPPTGLRQLALYAPGKLYIDPVAGAANISGAGGTYVGEVVEPIIMTYDVKKLSLTVDRYGDQPVDHRNISSFAMITIKLAEHNTNAKKLFWGDGRITADGGVNIPGPDLENAAVSRTPHSFLFVTTAAAQGLSDYEAYYKNFYILRGQAYPSANSNQIFGNEHSPLEIDIFATPCTEDDTKAYYAFRSMRIEKIANITIYSV